MAYFFTEKGSEEKQQILEQLYFKYVKLMKYIANQILRDEYLAEDAVQAAFLKLEKNKFRIDSISCNKTKSLMVIIVRNSAIGIYNSKKKVVVSYEDDDLKEIPDDNLLPIEIVISNENVVEIRNAINILDPKYSDILTMKYIENYTNSDIASLFGITEQLVRVRLHRGKKLLLEYLDERKASNE